jgi:hypothetical protein
MTVPPSILTLDTTGTPFIVAVQKAGHAEPRDVGSKWYTFYGAERSGIHAQLMNVPLVLVHTQDLPLDATIIAAVRALFALGAQRYCNGEVFNNGLTDILCSGELTDDMEPGTSPETWIVNLTLSEVENAGTSL